MQKEQFIALAISHANANSNSNIAWIAGKMYDALVKEGYEIVYEQGNAIRKDA